MSFYLEDFEQRRSERGIAEVCQYIAAGSVSSVERAIERHLLVIDFEKGHKICLSVCFPEASVG